MVRRAAGLLPADRVLVATGGVDSVERAWEMLRHADLVGVYTGLVFRGPGLLRELRDGVAARLRRRGRAVARRAACSAPPIGAGGPVVARGRRVSVVASGEAFGDRLARAVDARGPLCVGIDPHPGLLDAWGLPDDADGLERFALGGRRGARPDVVAVLKPQVGVLRAARRARGRRPGAACSATAREAGALTIADAKRGDIGSTMAAYADAYLGDGSPLAADAVTRVAVPRASGRSRPALDGGPRHRPRASSSWR